MREWRIISWAIVLFGGVLVGPTLMAQATTVAGAVAAAGAETQEWGYSVVWAFLGTSVLEWIKRHPTLTMISEETAWWAQRIIGVVLAMATALGVHVAFDATAGVLTVSGLLWPSIWQIGTESLRQFVFNELTYRIGVKNYGK